jgi:hypothetical protein
MLNITENIKSLLFGEWEKIDFSSVNNDKNKFTIILDQKDKEIKLKSNIEIGILSIVSRINV